MEGKIPAYLKGLASSNRHMLNTCYPLMLTALQLGAGLGQRNRGVTFHSEYLWQRHRSCKTLVHELSLQTRPPFSGQSVANLCCRPWACPGPQVTSFCLVLTWPHLSTKQSRSFDLAQIWKWSYSRSSKLVLKLLWDENSTLYLCPDDHKEPFPNSWSLLQEEKRGGLGRFPLTGS